MNMQAILPMLAIASGLAMPAAIADGPPMSGGDYKISAYTVESAGGRAAGGAYTIHASVGQLDAHGQIAAGALAAEGGFWQGGKGPGDTLFKDGFE